MLRTRARRFVFIALVFTCLTPLVAPIFQEAPDRGETVDHKPLNPYAQHSTTSADQKNSYSSHECREIEIPKTYISSKELMIPTGRLELNKNIADLINEARGGREMSAITLFFLAGSCAPFRDYVEINNVLTEEKMAVKQHTCSMLPADIINSPLTALEVAATNGSVKAQILYAENAPIITRYMAFASPNELNNVQSDILNKAEKYAIAAANSGVAQAYSILLDSSEAGRLGQQDRAKAYAYGLSLAKIDRSPELEEKLNYIYKSLTRDELSRARSLMQSCTSDNEISFDSLRELL